MNFERTVQTLADRAKTFLREFSLYLDENEFEFGEVEVYYHSLDFPDEYPHRHAVQTTTGSFYLHRHSNGSFKNGTFKGIDYTFGSEGIFASFLVRSIVGVTKPEVAISGPCNVVNFILSALNLEMKDLEKCSRVRVQKRSTPSDRFVLCGPRIGLSMKYPSFRDLPLRFVTFPQLIQKGRDSIVRNLRNQGFSKEKIVKLTGYRPASVARWLQS